MAYSGMHRTTLVIDQRKLAKARKLLGTKGIKDTVERALDEVIAYAARAKAVEQRPALPLPLPAAPALISALAGACKVQCQRVRGEDRA